MMTPRFVRAMTAAERRGRAVAEDRAGQLEAALRATGVSVARDGGDVTVTGRGVLDAPELRWPGGLLR